MGRLNLSALIAAASLLAAATPAVAEIAPRSIHGGAGYMALNTYSQNYQPTTAMIGVTSFGLDIALTSRWSGTMDTMMSTDESLTGFSMGGRFSFTQRRLITTGGKSGYVQYTTTSVPRWHFDMGAAVARYRFSQLLATNDPFTISALRKVPVKADLYGLQLTPGVQFAFDERWAIQSQYAYNYAVADGFNIVAHAFLIGGNFAF